MRTMTPKGAPAANSDVGREVGKVATDAIVASVARDVRRVRRRGGKVSYTPRAWTLGGRVD